MMWRRRRRPLEWPPPQLRAPRGQPLQSVASVFLPSADRAACATRRTRKAATSGIGPHHAAPEADGLTIRASMARDVKFYTPQAALTAQIRTERDHHPGVGAALGGLEHLQPGHRVPRIDRCRALAPDRGGERGVERRPVATLAWPGAGRGPGVQTAPVLRRHHSPGV